MHSESVNRTVYRSARQFEQAYNRAWTVYIVFYIFSRKNSFIRVLLLPFIGFFDICMSEMKEHRDLPFAIFGKIPNTSV